MEKKQKKHSRSCAFCLYEVLLAHLAEAHEDCGNLCAGCVILRVQLAVRAVDNAVRNRPLHCICCIGADGSCIREAVELAVCLRRAGVAVQLVGFGSFEAKERPARVGRNPRTGEPMTYPACKVPVFKPGKALKDAIR